MTLQDDEGPIDAEIARLLTEAIPESWASAVLDVELVRQDDGSDGFVHRITSPQGYRDLVSPPDQLYELTIRLFDLFSRAGRPWRGVRYGVSAAEDGAWDYHVHFEY